MVDQTGAEFDVGEARKLLEEHGLVLRVCDVVEPFVYPDDYDVFYFSPTVEVQLRRKGSNWTRTPGPTLDAIECRRGAQVQAMVLLLTSLRSGDYDSHLLPRHATMASRMIS